MFVKQYRFRDSFSNTTRSRLILKVKIFKSVIWENDLFTRNNKNNKKQTKNKRVQNNVNICYDRQLWHYS